MANQDLILNDMLDKLGVINKQDRSRLISKSKEMSDLVDLKLRGGNLVALNDIAKVIMVIDISSEILNIPFDANSGIRFSSMKKTAYNKTRNVLLKLLNFNKMLDVAGMMRKVGVANDGVNNLAKRIYENCKLMNEEHDLDHPQYIAMTVYQACKHEKVKVAKNLFIQASNLKHSQWTELEKKWDKWVSDIAKSSNNKDKTAKKDKPTKIELIKAVIERKSSYDDPLDDPQLPYDEWAKRILQRAEVELKTEC